MSDFSKAVAYHIRHSGVGFDIQQWGSAQSSHELQCGRNECGTTACVAGHILLADGYRYLKKKRVFRKGRQDVSAIGSVFGAETASAALAVWRRHHPNATDEQLSLLENAFAPEFWPNEKPTMRGIERVLREASK